MKRATQRPPLWLMFVLDGPIFHNTLRTAWIFSCICFSWTGQTVDAAAPSPEIEKESKRCFGLYQKKFFLQATKCYEALRVKHQSPQYLVNIAQSYRLAALNQLNPVDASILREKAIETLLQYKKEAPQANFWSDSMIQKLEKQIGRAGVSLTSTPADTSYVLTGPKYLTKGTLPFTSKLRPGSYTLQLTAEGYEPKQHTFEVKTGSPVTLQLVLVAVQKKQVDDEKKLITRTAPPPAKGKPTPLFWAAVAVAGAMLVTGFVFVGAAAGNQGQIDNPNTPAKQARDALYQSGWQTPTGWTFVGLGVAAGAGAVVLLFLPQKKSEETMTLMQKKKKNASLSFLLEKVSL